MNQWVEASAGSGKTTDLITQVLTLLKEGRAQLPDIVAITFTEKAAGELKLKVREKLEEQRLAAQGEVRQRLDRAVFQLEQAHFQTFHGFCQELLQERPVEACIDPLFTILGKSEADGLFRECFHDWFQAQLQAPPPGLTRLLRRRFRPTDWQGRPAGVRTKLEELARRLRDHRDQPREWIQPPEGLYRAEQLWEDLLSFNRAVPGKLYKNIQKIWNGLHVIIQETSFLPLSSEEREALLCRCRKEVRTLSEPGPQKNDSNRFSGQLFEWKQRLEDWGRRADASLMAHLRQELEPLLADYESRKLQLGRLDFLDLMLHTRRLLQQPDLRAHFQRRHPFLFVDEFQDTDPIQADIIELLSLTDSPPARPPVPPVGGLPVAPLTDSPAARPPVPPEGGLYVVGDPKQAIYRFRRGDLAVYRKVKEARRDLERRSLCSNYRSLPNLVHFFNRAFASVFGEDEHSLQAGFEAMVPKVSAEGCEQPSLVLLPMSNPEDDKAQSATRLRQEMASKTSAFLDWLLRRSNCKVRDEKGQWRPLESRDVCLLFRTVSQNLQVMAEALDSRDIPHLALSGRGLHQREEVQALRVALEAIEWPQDNLSVFATLRGPLFGLEEPTLFHFFNRHRHFNPLLTEEEDHEVARALRLLADLHAQRNRRPAGATLEHLLSASGARLHFSLWPQGSQCLANLSRIVRLAWNFEARGASSFRALVEHLLELAQSDSDAEGLAPDAAVEGVRMLTVHSSKGLEFPVVVLADPATRQLAFDVSEVSHPDTHLYACGLDDLRPWEFTSLAEREEAIQRAECDRLAYVAATRARDMLILPALRGATARNSWMSPLLKAASTPLQPSEEPVKMVLWDEARLASDMPLPPALEDADLFAKDGDGGARALSAAWRSQERCLREAAREGLVVVAAAHADLEGPVEVVALGGGPSGLALGRRLHQLLANLPFNASRAEVEAQAGELAERVWAVMSSPLWREGWREVPLTLQLDTVIVEGVADLVFRDENHYTVVDFKSDGDRPEYRSQLAAYARALGQATGSPVRAVMALI